MNEINKEERMQGLSGQQVSESKAKYGTNELAKKETESLWSMFIGAFDDIWIKVLCAALALKVILAVLGIFVPALSGGNDVAEIISIVIAIALATGFSTLSEYRNTSRSEALQEEYSKTYAKVVRDGKLVNILTSEIVKGDTILIQAGDKVPADGLLFEGKIKVSQAALNGESRDENKAAVTNMDEAESTDYSSHGKVFMGSVVTSGEGYMIATVIGDSSELGKINKALTDTSEEEERKDTSSLKLEGVAAGIGKMGCVSCSDRRYPSCCSDSDQGRSGNHCCFRSPCNSGSSYAYGFYRDHGSSGGTSDDEQSGSVNEYRVHV